MGIRLITTVGGAYSNSYATIKEADTFAVNFPWYNDIVDANGNVIKGWSTFTETEQRQALIQAAFSMDGLPWAGTKCKPASDAGLPIEDWDQYFIKKGTQSPDGVFGYFDDAGIQSGVGQGSDVLRWGIEGQDFLKNVSSFRRKTFETGFTFWDKDDNELPIDRFEVVSQSGSSGDTTRDLILFWDTPVNIAYLTGTFNDSFNPGRTGMWFWGAYVNGEQLLNFPGTTADQAQRMAWPRSGVTCEGDTATCDFIPNKIKSAQILIAYNFLIKPYLVPGTPGLPPSAPEGTYVKRQKLDVLEIEYQQYQGFDPTADPCIDKCNDPYLYQTFDWLADLLGCWVTDAGSNREVRLYRN